MLMKRGIKTLAQARISGKRVLLRVDYNVPLKGTKVSDNTRIKASLPTIKQLLKKGAKQIIIVTHLGRPKGKFNAEFKLDPIAKELEKLLKRKVVKTDDIETIEKSKIIMLENIRFQPGEKKNDSKLAKMLASIADIYVNDAFGVSHRKHMSVHAITKYLPSYAGLLLQKEYETITNILSKPKRPFIALIGAAKIKGKIDIISSLLKKVDAVLLGGGIIFTFYKSIGINIGKSLCDNSELKTAKKILLNSNKKLILPTDVNVASSLKSKGKDVSINNIAKNKAGYDIGRETIESYKEILSKAKTIIWNGPMGVAELPAFAKGTKELTKVMGKNKKIIVGGGDTVAIIKKMKLENKFTFISTGGGAFLDLVSGKKLPGIEVLKNARRS